MGRRILVRCDDLIFWARIHDAARAAGGSALRVSDEAAMERAWKEGEFAAVLADLGSQYLDPYAWARRWKTQQEPPRRVAWVSHVDTEAKERARQAGFDLVLPWSRFSQILPDLL